MKASSILLSIATLILSSLATCICAQNLQGGKITYEQIVDYQLDDAYDEPIWKQYIEGLPREGKSIHVLYFTASESFYEEDLSKKEVMSEHLKTAVMKANYYKTPKPKVKQTYLHFQEKKHIQQISFLTRNFLVESALETKAWKLNGRRKKVMAYVCMGADLTIEDATITAWFSPELPFPTGPEAYNGLPGIILGLEKEDKVFLLATSIDLEVPTEDLTAKLNKGQTVRKEKFEQIVLEKTAEYKKNREIEKKNNAKMKKN